MQGLHLQEAFKRLKPNESLATAHKWLLQCMQHLAAACANLRHLTNNNPGSRRCQLVTPTTQSSIQQELSRRLEAHLQQWTCLAVYSYSVAGLVTALVGHEVRYQAQVTGVNPNAISTKHSLR